MSDPKIILAMGGSDRREVSLVDLEIPDMWHLAEALSTLNKRCKHLQSCPLAPLGREGWPESDARMVLETWHLAHDLKDNLLVQHGLKRDPLVVSDSRRSSWDRILGR